MDEPEMSFSSVEHEMVARAPILEDGLRTVTFKADMMKVWDMISVITRDLCQVRPEDKRRKEGLP